MSWLRAIPFLFTLLAFVLPPASASALGNAHPEARVSAFELVATASVGASAETSPGLHEGIGEACDENASGYHSAARGSANAVPGRVARVIPGDVNPTTLGRPGSGDVFVTAADDIAGMTPAQIAERLTIPDSRSFTVIEFPTPAEGLASPVLRSNPGFVGGGRTAGGAREFVIPNGPIPEGAVIRRVGP